MANNKVGEGQQKAQPITIGTQGNQDTTTPQGNQGNFQTKEGQEDRHIPNQDRSSATNAEREAGKREPNQ